MSRDALWQDVRYGLRLFVARPGFTLVAILTLAIGIGANTAIFSAVTALLLRPVPVVDPDRIVFGLSMREGFDPFGTALLEYAALRSSPAFAASGVADFHAVTLAGRDEPERVAAATITAGYFATLGTAPVVGRTITVGDDRPDAAPVAVIGYELWQRRFGGAASVLGDTLLLDNGPHTIVGVMPRGFDMPGGARVWTPLGINIEPASRDERAPRSYELVARLAPGVALAQANADVKRIARRLEDEYSLTRRGWSYELVTLRQQLLGDLAGRTRLALLTLEAAVGFLLLICCANVASLLLVRGVAREREIAVRLALGAARSRVVRQLLAESALLGIAGGALGLLIAGWLTPALAALNPIRAGSMATFLTDFTIDRRVMLFAAATSIATGLVFGIVPALIAARAGDVASALKQREQRTGAGRSRRWLGALVAAEIAIAVVLLVNGSLIVQSFARLQRTKLGFNPDRLVTVELTASAQRYPSHADRVTYVNRLLDRARNVPGVSDAGITTNIPLQVGSIDSIFTVEGRPLERPSDVPITAHRLVSADYLPTLGVQLVKGRLLDDHDREGTQPVVVITEELARQAWPGADAIGRRIRRGRAQDTIYPWMTVVGVVADTKEDSFNFRINRPAWYVPYAQQTTAGLPLHVVVRASGDANAIARDLRAAVRSVDDQQAVSPAIVMTDHVAEILVTERFSAVLMTTLASIGLFLAACGLYGVVAYSASQRTGEIGLRMALGADRRDVLALVMGQGAAMVALGLAAGVVFARALSVALAGTLYGVNPNDPLTFATVILVLAAVSAAACYLPALRATRVDPLVALRSE